jgi:hypothetical protein
MDVDYKALSNAGVWFVGRLQTDADRARVVDGLTGTSTTGDSIDAGALGDVLKSLPGRTFYVRNVHDNTGPKLLESRWTLSWLRGPMTRQEIRRLSRASVTMQPEVAAVEQPTASQAVAVQPAVMAVPPTRVLGTEGSAEVPPVPDGWRTWHAPAPANVASTTWIYQPWVAASIVAHVRDARLGVQANRTVRAMAPLGDDGRPDTTRGRVFDPQWFSAQPLPGATHGTLPDSLFRKGGTTTIERTLRDEVYRSLQVSVQTHKGFNLTAAPDEQPAAFVQRIQAEATRRAGLAQQEIATRHAAKIQRANDDVTNARASVAAADQALPTGGALATAAALIRGGKRALQRLETQQDRQAAKAEKTRADLADAEAALREAMVKRDADLAEAAREAQDSVNAIESKSLTPKKDDIEVTEIGVAWVPTPR